MRKKESVTLKTEYSVNAMFSPADKYHQKFGVSKQVIIFRPTELTTSYEQKGTLTKEKVGGICGCLFITRSSTIVKFDRKEYYPGEAVKVTLNCDNSECSKAVENFILQLVRKSFGKDG